MILIAIALLGPGARAANVAPAPTAASSLFSRIDPGRRIPPPRIRIGIKADENEVRVGATGVGFRILDGRLGATLWPERAAGPVLVVPQGGRSVGEEKRYRIQVGAFRDESAARAQAKALEEQHRAPAEVVRDPARNVWRIRLGLAERAADLAQLLSAVRSAGQGGAFIAAEPKPTRAGPGSALQLLDAHWETRAAGVDRIVVVPEGEGFVTVDGRPYRGLLEVFLGASGGVAVANEVNLEDYLRGVVPEELGPSLFPEIEALKAQAIAARTYAAANLGQFAADGFDLCDAPRCQVYGGVASEHPTSDRAVRETSGEILVFEGRPINAMFTSTCGGRTENVGVVFPELQADAAYLRGVECRPEEEALERRLQRIIGRPVAPGEVAATPPPLDLARLIVHGVLPRESRSVAWQSVPVGREEVGRWGVALAERAGRPAAAPFAGTLDKLAIWRWLASAFGFPADSGGLVAPGDEDFVLAVQDRAAIPAADRLLAANLLVRGLWQPGPDGRLAPEAIPTRGEVLDWLVRAGNALDAAPVREGLVVRRAPHGVVLREKGANREWTWDGEVLDLFVETAGAWRPISAVDVLPGDRVVYAGDEAQGRLALLGIKERKGSADDRGSPKFRWTLVREREYIESRLAELTPVGRLLDIIVLSRGPSGRVAELELRGTSGVATIEGFRFRSALELPETLFSFDIQRAQDGAVRRVTFFGRGWGHGVGLCQYGAYGMAVRGMNHREILQRYYTGVELARLPGSE